MDILLGIAVVNAWSVMNGRHVEANMKPLQITEFMEELCEQLLQHGQSTSVPKSSVNASAGHFLHETTLKQSGKRPDRRVRKYCIGCYAKLKEKHGREIARKKTKRVTTECRACNAHYCFGCF